MESKPLLPPWKRGGSEREKGEREGIFSTSKAFQERERSRVKEEDGLQKREKAEGNKTTGLQTTGRRREKVPPFSLTPPKKLWRCLPDHGNSDLLFLNPFSFLYNLKTLDRGCLMDRSQSNPSRNSSELLPLIKPLTFHQASSEPSQRLITYASFSLEIRAKTRSKMTNSKVIAVCWMYYGLC